VNVSDFTQLGQNELKFQAVVEAENFVRYLQNNHCSTSKGKTVLEADLKMDLSLYVCLFPIASPYVSH
jgi:hypothetical protein